MYSFYRSYVISQLDEEYDGKIYGIGLVQAQFIDFTRKNGKNATSINTNKNENIDNLENKFVSIS